ncbi:MULTISPECIES: helix-turn-helix domain-containing protein [Rahnella]|nr:MULTISPECIES: helix-turn-helix domain-containing protein [Rahnella]
MLFSVEQRKRIFLGLSHMSVTAPLDPQTDCRRVNEVLSRVGDRWTMQVVVTLQEQPRRFNDIKRQVGNISQQMLTRTLKALERDGMILRTVCSTSPPQVEYALTDLGKSLSEPVRQLAQWARLHISLIHENRERYDEND